MVVGMEIDFFVCEVVGFMFGYMCVGMCGSDNVSGNDVNVDVVYVGGYVGLDMDGWMFDGVFMVGGNYYSSQCVISFFGQIVSGSYNGWQVGVCVEVGLFFVFSQCWLGCWLVGLCLLYLSNEGYIESGNVVLVQNVEFS